MSVSKPAFSVVVPVYNTERFLDECISSIVNQTERDIEIILVDDGSDDNSPAICDKWAATDNRIVVIHKENGGVVSACKAGFEIARGKYFSKVDSDDWISEDFYLKLKECVINNKPEVVVTDYIAEPSGEVVHNDFVKNIVTDGPGFIKSNFHVHTSNDICFSCRMVFLIDFLKKNNLFFAEDMKIGEDTVLNIKAIFNAQKVIAIDYAGYHYRIDNENSVMRKKYKESLEKDLSAQYETRRNCFNDIDTYVYDMSVYYVTRIFASVMDNCKNSPTGLTYKDVKRIFNSKWLTDSYRHLGFSLPFKSVKENLVALTVKFRLPLIYYLYVKFIVK